MPNGPIRRAHLITPFGTGSLYVGRDGVSLISAGLDYWYVRESGETYANDREDEFKISEWRLERALSVDHFRMPADYRIPLRFQGDSIPNRLMTQPFLRFPCWHLCENCSVLKEGTLTVKGRMFCDAVAHKGQKFKMFQVPYVAICRSGHIQDFPWCEFVHRDPNPGPDIRSHTMKLINRGAVGLGAERVQCECGQNRSLGAILNVDKKDGTGLLSQLTGAPQQRNKSDEAPQYLCTGQRPWLGTNETSQCGELLSGALRGASNVYFPHTRSSIYVPRGEGDVVSSELVPLIETPETMGLIRHAVALLEGRPEAEKMQELVGFLRHQIRDKLTGYTDDQIGKALSIILDPGDAASGTDDPDSPEAFLRAEFNVLRVPKKEQDLKVRAVALNEYRPSVQKYFDRIMLVDKLRETRALIGFSRVFEETTMSLSDLKGMMRLTPPNFSNSNENWLPAHTVFGEGIFFEFSESSVSDWEKRLKISARLSTLIKRYEDVQEQRHAEPRPVSQRLVLVHTFAHLMINALTFQCGYSAASLRERLYVSDDDDHPMAAVLLYTASGDADGTMGGLVRMGKPGFLEPVIESAVNDARWCSADPVCMEIGASAGQGPDSCNLAACHNCALVPETSCEIFNKLLDRATLIGDLGDRSIGFFS